MKLTAKLKTFQSNNFSMRLLHLDDFFFKCLENITENIVIPPFLSNEISLRDSIPSFFGDESVFFYI